MSQLRKCVLNVSFLILTTLPLSSVFAAYPDHQQNRYRNQNLQKRTFNERQINIQNEYSAPRYNENWWSPPPPTAAEAFPGDAEADALYREIQNR